jgi:hypothetical protein
MQVAPLAHCASLPPPSIRNFAEYSAHRKKVVTEWFYEVRGGGADAVADAGSVVNEFGRRKESVWVQLQNRGHSWPKRDQRLSSVLLYTHTCCPCVPTPMQHIVGCMSYACNNMLCDLFCNAL